MGIQFIGIGFLIGVGLSSGIVWIFVQRNKHLRAELIRVLNRGRYGR